MPLTDDEKSALGFVELVGPVLMAIGSSAGIADIHDVGAMLGKIPVGDVAGWFGKWRKDLIDIDKGTMDVGEGVEVVVDDGA